MWFEAVILLVSAFRGSQDWIFPSGFRCGRGFGGGFLNLRYSKSDRGCVFFFNFLMSYFIVPEVWKIINF